MTLIEANQADPTTASNRKTRRKAAAIPTAADARPESEQIKAALLADPALAHLTALAPVGGRGSELLFSSDMRRDYLLPESTWRYWASLGKGPKSFLLGRRRVWRRSDVDAWLAQQESA